MTYQETQERPHGGLVVAIDLTWDRRDTGGAWLIVERGGRFVGLPDMYTSTGRLVATAATEQRAEAIARQARRRLHAQGCLSAIVDIVPRAAVAIRSASGPYGCMAEEGGS